MADMDGDANLRYKHFASNAETMCVDGVEDLVEELFVNVDEEEAVEKRRSEEEASSDEYIKVENCYQCDYCEQTFGSADALVTHFAEYKKCQHCGEIFCRTLPYKLHVIAHTLTRTYSCSECPATFNLRPNLERHRKDHSTGRVDLDDDGPRPHECRVCGRKFAHQPELRAHVQAAHASKGRKSCTLYECDYCGKCTTEKAALVKHIRVHTGEKPFHCDCCGKRFRQKGYLRIHARRRHHQPDEVSFQCDVCKVRYASKSRLAAHIESHLDGGGGGAKFACSFCAKRLTSRQTLREHLKLHTKEGLFECDLCDKQYPSAGNLRNHRRCHEIGEQAAYTCAHCGRGFSQKCNLKRHLRSHFGEEGRVTCEHCQRRFTVDYYKVHLRLHTGEKPYECQFCGKRFTQCTTYKDHLTLHTGQKPFECAVCWRRFVHRSQYNRHLTTHPAGDGGNGVARVNSEPASAAAAAARTVGELRLGSVDAGEGGGGLFRCTICEKWFASKSAMVCHVRVHTGEKPYQCGECGKRFAQKSNLTVHREIHADGRKKPFRCAVCNTSCSTKSKLKYHLAVHRKERPFLCNQCDKRFKYKSTLNSHVLHAHQLEKVQCDVCQKSFSSKSNLNHHIEKHIEEHIFY